MGFFLMNDLKEKGLAETEIVIFLIPASATVNICEWKIFAEFHDICWAISINVQISAGKILHARAGPGNNDKTLFVLTR